MSLNDDQLEPAEPIVFPIPEGVPEPDALQVGPTDEPVEATVAEDEAADGYADEAIREDSVLNETPSEEIVEAHATEAEAVEVADEVDESQTPDEESAFDELIASYQSHMLDEEPEPEFIAHVQAKAAAPVVVPASAPAVAETVKEVEAIVEPTPVVPPQSVILDLVSCPVARSVQAESVPLSHEEQNGQEADEEEDHADEVACEPAPAGPALRTEMLVVSEEVRSADPTAHEPDVEESVAEWQPMPADQPAPVVPVVAYARQLLVETPDEELSPLGFDDEATDEDEWQEDVEVADASNDQPAEESAQDVSNQQDDEHYEEDEAQEADYEEAAALVDPDDDESDADLEPVSSGGGWTLPLLCIGIAIIACCMVIPQADANRRLAYERAALRTDLESIQTQVATNDEFLRKLASDPALAERLAQRQLNLQRAGTRVLPIRTGDSGTSPFDLVQVPKPPKMEPYEPIGGTVAAICRDTRARLYTMGVGLFILAAGLVMGFSPNPRLRD